MASPHPTGSSLSRQSSVLPLEGCCQGPQQEKNQVPGEGRDQSTSASAPPHTICFFQGGHIPCFELH